jgi:ADP-ribosylglycohydrolase
MMHFIIECRGDVDTIGAMAGALWGIANGSGRLPAVDIEARSELVNIASRMFQRHESQ